MLIMSLCNLGTTRMNNLVITRQNATLKINKKHIAKIFLGPKKMIAQSDRKTSLSKSGIKSSHNFFFPGHKNYMVL